MLLKRVMPCLLLKNKALVKTIKFKKPSYIGAPINTVHIYNTKEVDELILLDITATPENKKPPFEIIEEIATQCFMPLTYGGGINNIDDVKTIFSLGVEKIVLNTFAVENPSFITQAAEAFGNQSIVVSIDVKRSFLGKYEVYTTAGQKPSRRDPVSLAMEMEERGAGEILLTSIDMDGTMEGYDINLIKQVTDAVNIPVIACGGAGNINDFAQAVKEGGASAVAAGSMFVYQGKNRAVLINFPVKKDLTAVLS